MSKDVVLKIEAKMRAGFLSVGSVKQQISRFKREGKEDKATLYQDALDLFVFNNMKTKLTEKGVIWMTVTTICQLPDKIVISWTVEGDMTNYD